jgi:hypothetical protein
MKKPLRRQRRINYVSVVDSVPLNESTHVTFMCRTSSAINSRCNSNKRVNSATLGFNSPSANLFFISATAAPTAATNPSRFPQAFTTIHSRHKPTNPEPDQPQLIRT